jgi:hypothetical protein
VGLGYLFLYNAVFVLPLAVILLIAGDRAVVERVQAWKKRSTRPLRLAGAISMVALGAVIFAF